MSAVCSGCGRADDEITTRGHRDGCLEASMSEPIKYEVGGTLIDANGGRWRINMLLEGDLRAYIETRDHRKLEEAELSHYRYEPPYRAKPMTRELENALTCWHNYPVFRKTNNQIATIQAKSFTSVFLITHPEQA